MVNPNKKFVIHQPATNRKQLLTEKELTNFQRLEHSKEWTSLGYEKPEGAASCWYISEDERKDAIRNKRPYGTGSYATEYFKITSRIDGIFIEGCLGHTESKKYFFRVIDNTFTFFKDFNAGKLVYFTFDRVTLYKLMEIFPTNPMKFILKRLDNARPVIKDQVFMIMPFGSGPLDEFYQENIKAFLKTKMDIDVRRADSYLDNDVIINTIYKQIEDSEIIIADITDNNKNCFYELGYASAIGKEIITIQRNNPAGSFFDRSHIRYINYDYEEELKFQTELEGTILSIRNRQ